LLLLLLLTYDISLCCFFSFFLPTKVLNKLAKFKGSLKKPESSKDRWKKNIGKVREKEPGEVEKDDLVVIDPRDEKRGGRRGEHEANTHMKKLRAKKRLGKW